MRLVRVLVPEGKRQAVIDTLEERGVDYSITDETGDREYIAIVTFPLPHGAVEEVIEALGEIGIDDSTCTVILEAEAILSERFEELEAAYAPDTEALSDGIVDDERIAREELQERAEELVSGTPTYLLLTLVSTVVATAGLLLDSPATVVGSMVIAPLIGPSMAASVGTVLDDRELFDRGVRMQLLGIAVAVLGATVFGFLVRQFFLVPPGIDVLGISEVAERGTPNVLVLVIAIGAGIAGIVSLMTGVSTSLVGVMIAVALIPPAAAVGIGVSFGLPRLAIGAGIFVVVNVLSINLSSLLTLWFGGYRPPSLFSARQVRSELLVQVLALSVAIAVVSVFLVGVTYDSYVAATTEEDIRDAVNGELAAHDADLQLRGLTVERSGTVPPLETQRVLVRIAVDPDATVPRIVDGLAERIEPVTESPTDVEVEYVFVQKNSSSE